MIPRVIGNIALGWHIIPYSDSVITLLSNDYYVSLAFMDAFIFEWVKKERAVD